MPSVSQKQQKLMALAEHNPSAVYSKNKGVLKMTHKQLHDFASTPRKGLPKKVRKMAMGGVVDDPAFHSASIGKPLRFGSDIVNPRHTGTTKNPFGEQMKTFGGSIKIPGDQAGQQKPHGGFSDLGIGSLP